MLHHTLLAYAYTLQLTAAERRQRIVVRDAIVAKYGDGWVEILMDIVAMVCRETLRDPDILGRYSDSVLAFILPESADAAGVQLAARLIEGVSDIRLPSAKGALTFTVKCRGCRVGRHGRRYRRDLQSGRDTTRRRARRGGRAGQGMFRR